MKNGRPTRLGVGTPGINNNSFTDEELAELESVTCPDCGDTFKLPGMEMRKIPSTHLKSGGKEGTAIMQVATCLTCKIQKAITTAMMNLAKTPAK